MLPDPHCAQDGPGSEWPAIPAGCLTPAGRRNGHDAGPRHVRAGSQQHDDRISSGPAQTAFLRCACPGLRAGGGSDRLCLEGMHATSMVEHDNAHFLALAGYRARAASISCSRRAWPRGLFGGDLAALRQRVFRSKYVADIARIDNGALRCSAVWGRMAPSARAAARGAGRCVTGSSCGRTWRTPSSRSCRTTCWPARAAGGFHDSGHLRRHRASARRRAKTTLYSRKQSHHVYKVFDASAAEDWQGWGAGFQLVRTAAACAPWGPDICVETTARVDARGAVAVAGLGGMALERRGRAYRIPLVAQVVRAARQPDRPRCARARYRWLINRCACWVRGAWRAWRRWRAGRMTRSGRSPGHVPRVGGGDGPAPAFHAYIVQAALDGMKTRMAGDAPFYLSINVFPEDLEDESFLDFLTQSVRERRG